MNYFNDNRNHWYNFKTKEYEYIETPKSFVDYLPQEQASQGLYQIYILEGRSPIDACRLVLEILAGKSNET